MEEKKWTAVRPNNEIVLKKSCKPFNISDLQKQDRIYRYCDLTYLVTQPLAKIDDLNGDITSVSALVDLTIKTEYQKDEKSFFTMQTNEVNSVYVFSQTELENFIAKL